MIVVGIDPSSRCTGLAAIRVGTDVKTRKGRTTREPDEVLKVLKFSKTGTHDWNRVDVIMNEVGQAVLDIGCQVDLAVIEGYALSAGSRGSSSVHKLVEVGTAIKVKLDRLLVPWIVVPPSSLKKFIGAKAGKVGSRNARNKKPVAEMVAQHWGFTDPSNDIVDAYALAQVGASVMVRSHYKTPAQLEVASALIPAYKAAVRQEQS